MNLAPGKSNENQPLIFGPNVFFLRFKLSVSFDIQKTFESTKTLYDAKVWLFSGSSRGFFGARQLNNLISPGIVQNSTELATKSRSEKCSA